MYPILFRVFGVAVPSYAVFMVLGYVFALGVIYWLTRKVIERDEPDAPPNWGQAWDLFLVMVISSVLGSKIGHTLFEAPGHIAEDGHRIESLWELLREDPFHWAWIGESGYVWYGGMIGALLVAIFYFRRRPHLNAWHYCDVFAPAIMVGAMVGRLGCFLAGCCHGVETDVPWAVMFPRLGQFVHPTQLYDAAVAGGLGILLIWRYPRRRFNGENIALLLMTYPILRATTEIYRGDAERGGFGPLSTSQWLSIPLLIIGAYLYWRGINRNPPQSAAPPPDTPEVGNESPV